MGLRSPVFISYAHEDEKYLTKILTHLEPLRMQNQVCAWSDRDLRPGSEWGRNIGVSIANARVFLLLISKHYLASAFIRKSELPGLLNDHLSFVPVLPLLLSPCLYDLTSFHYPDPENGPHVFNLASIQFFNDPQKPLSTLSENKQDEIFVKLAKTLFETTHPR